ncbi:restriction endonuclease [Elizabethkingia anophelis]|nr:restriction endonuclease [Elizabethkingia anophelis]MDV3687987.1 restriction endonuclease [Elizabethkingia anophelis]MDV3785413.1 restriction endonuclease [Elizabethkingia anophelis]MDV3810251.1 restriction endonuclease [Elizabethkingia anophelis]MDV3817459.1 restriction endonuclease [Elizabethkingia anophelis]
MELLSSNYNPAKLSSSTAQKVWSEYLSKSDIVRIATGYVSSESLIELQKIIEVNINPKLDILIGMHYFEGFTKQQYEATIALNETLKSKDRGNIFISNKLKFHGKLYSFNSDKNCLGAIIGSSNLSSITGTSNRLYEVDYLLKNEKAKEIDHTILNIFEKLGTNFSDLPPITNFITQNDLLKNHYGVQEVSPSVITQMWDTKTDIYFDIPIKTEPKSNLNTYFGKGRVNQRGFEVPRPWYEAELIVSKKITILDNYPRNKAFQVFTDDGWTFKCETNGQNSKNFRSQNDLTILGKWIKGRLENNGSLKIGHPVTDDTLNHYGNNIMKLIATNDPDIWLIDFKNSISSYMI